MKTLLSLIEPSPKSADKIFKFYSDAMGETALSKDEIRRQSLQVAAALQPFAITKGEPVLLVAYNSPFFVRSFFGILMAGGVPVPVAPPDLIERTVFKQNLKHVAATCQARGVLSELPLASDLLPESLAAWTVAKDVPPLRAPVALAENDLALLQFSSGSTMAPKGAMLNHRALLANIEQIVTAMAISNDTLSSWLPFYHDMGLIGGLLAALASETVSHYGNALDFLQSPRSWIEHVSRSATTVIMGPNFLYKNLVKRVPEKSLDGLDLRHLRLALCGAEPVQPQVCSNFIEHYQRCGLNRNVLFPVYGLAENGLAVSFPKLDEKFVTTVFDAEALAGGHARPSATGVVLVACGYPLAGIELRLVKSSGEICIAGEVGEIQFRSPSQALGYYRNPEATRTVFVDGWVHSGDVGFVHEGRLYISGRLKDVMIFNGRNYHPADVENFSLLRGLGGGRLAVFSNFDHARQSEELFAIMESKAILPWSRRRLARRLEAAVWEFTGQRPKQVYIAPHCALPRTSSGKIKRYHLRELQAQNRLQSLTQWRGQWKAVTGPIKIKLWMARQIAIQRWRRLWREKNSEKLLSIFAEVVETEPSRLNLQTPFVQYDLDSLKVVALSERLREEGHEIPLGDFVRFRKLQDVVDYLGVHP